MPSKRNPKHKILSTKQYQMFKKFKRLEFIWDLGFRISKLKIPFLVLGFLLFSWWLMSKSFGIDSNGVMWVARHEVGDFGLHLALIRSVSWGSNIPVESPFFPGVPMPYHYVFDVGIGLLERIGVPIVLAMNGVSALLFAILMFLIFRISQQLFGKNILVGLVSVLFFLCGSSLSFLDFIKGKTLSLQIFRDIWLLPDYLHKGPFDGSTISIFFTLAPYLNQRHLIAGLVISLSICSILLSYLLRGRHIDRRVLVLLGVVLGAASRVHTLIFFGSMITCTLLLLLFKRYKDGFLFIVPALIVFTPHAQAIMGQRTDSFRSSFFDPGFLSTRPFSFASFLYFWWMNVSVALFTIPYGYMRSSVNQKRVFIAFFGLFVIANTFRFSFRIDHNHSLLNYFFLIAAMYSAYGLTLLWKRGFVQKSIAVALFVLLIASGVLNLMAVKNDFRYPITDEARAPLIEWIGAHTSPHAIFIAPPELLDPVVLAGRKNYLGHSYYLTVMGYRMDAREEFVKHMGIQPNVESMKERGIEYMLVSKNEQQPLDLRVVFETEDAVVYGL